MDQSQDAVVACANGWLFRSSVRALTTSLDELYFTNSARFSLKGRVPKHTVGDASRIQKDTIHQMPLVIGGNGRLEVQTLTYSGYPGVTLEVTPSDCVPYATLEVPFGLQEKFCCNLSYDGELRLSADRVGSSQYLAFKRQQEEVRQAAQVAADRLDQPRTGHRHAFKTSHSGKTWTHIFI